MAAPDVPGQRGPEPLPPAVLAARSAPAAGGRRPRASTRAYPSLVLTEDHEAVTSWLAATRSLLVAEAPEQVTEVLGTLVRDLGGGLVPARLADHTKTLPLDVALGLSEPVLPWAEPVSVAWMRLSTVLPTVVEDARIVLQRLQAAHRQGQEADVDQLTGLLTRRAWMRKLSTATAGASVALIDLDHFKAVNDEAGHAAGDAVLHAVGLLLRQHFRDDDACGRYGGDEIGCLVPGLPAEGLAARLQAVRVDWAGSRPRSARDVGLSIGVASVGLAAPLLALHAADRALYRAKAAGRDRTELAHGDELRP